MRMRATAASFPGGTWTLVFLPFLAWGAPPERPLNRQVAEHVLVRRIRWPVLLEPSERDGCAGLAASQIDVTEDGDPVSVTSLDRARPPRLHALLLDTSESMLASLDLVKRAAWRYVSRLPSGEAWMVASFDEVLELGHPPTATREGARQSIERVEIGRETALWDALYDAIRYLGSRPERKVLVLLTDGCDTLSLPQHDFPGTLALATEAPDLSIFVIGLGVRGTCGRADPENPRIRLQRLAERTGGHFYEVDAAAQLERAFVAIGNRLDREAFVTYEPRPFGKGSKDRAATESRRLRRVKVRARGKVPCNVRSAGPENRVELHGNPGAPEGSPKDAPEETATPARLSVPLPQDWSGGDGRQQSYLVVEHGGIRGHAPDLAVEQGALFDGRTRQRSGKYRIEASREPVFEMHDFEVEIPPLAYVRQHLVSPEDVVAHMIGLEDAPRFIHGKTFLVLRESIGQALFRYPDYREWVVEKRKAERKSEANALLEEYGEEARGLVESLLSVADSPRAEEPQRYLAEWLGDVRARDLSTALERKAANEVLRQRAGVHEPMTRTLERLERAWPKLLASFPPPTRVRVLTPLVPAFDPLREIIGFYRVLLPAPRESAPPLDRIPPAPLGLRTLAWLLQDPAVAATLSGRMEVLSIEDGEPSRGEVRRLRRERGSEAWVEVGSVSMQLAVPGDPSSTIWIQGYLPWAGGEPLRLRVRGEGEARGPMSEAAREISRWIRSKGVGE